MGKKKKLVIRLYRWHDMDLIMLYRNKNFSFGSAVKASLKAYANGDPLYFLPPPPDSEPKDLPPNYRILVTLDEDKDADILTMLKKTKDRHMNAAIKSILRGSMLGSYAYGCMRGKRFTGETEDAGNEMWAYGTIPPEYVSLPPAKNRDAKKNAERLLKQLREDAADKKMNLDDKEETVEDRPKQKSAPKKQKRSSPKSASKKEPKEEKKQRGHESRPEWDYHDTKEMVRPQEETPYIEDDRSSKARPERQERRERIEREEQDEPTYDNQTIFEDRFEDPGSDGDGLDGHDDYEPDSDNGGEGEGFDFFATLASMTG